MVEATTRYSVSLSHLRETFPEQNTEKIELQICAEILQKRLGKSILGRQKVLLRICALRGVGQQAPPFCYQRS